MSLLDTQVETYLIHSPEDNSYRIAEVPRILTAEDMERLSRSNFSGKTVAAAIGVPYQQFRDGLRGKGRLKWMRELWFRGKRNFSKPVLPPNMEAAMQAIMCGEIERAIGLLERERWLRRTRGI
jgi:hypothetical protein